MLGIGAAGEQAETVAHMLDALPRADGRDCEPSCRWPV
jgi:hypothetical protein